MSAEAKEAIAFSEAPASSTHTLEGADPIQSEL